MRYVHPIERFWPKVNKNGHVVRDDLGQCWEWTAATSRKGYGAFYTGGAPRMAPAHRFSYVEANGEIPDATPFVLHKCDNPPCVRPSHLFLGTKADNNRDMREKQRHARGEGNGIHKLTAGDVAAMRTRYAVGDVSFLLLGSQYGVSADAAHRAVKRESYGDLRYWHIERRRLCRHGGCPVKTNHKSRICAFHGGRL